MPPPDPTQAGAATCTGCGAWLVADEGEVCCKCLFAAVLDAAPDADACPAMLPPGAFGRYELHEVIGRGGMGVVWRATHRESGKVMALKMIAAPMLGGEAAVQRFHAEIEAAGSLDHPNIVPLHDSGESEGHAFYTMRYIEGAKPADAAPVALQRDISGIVSLVACVADGIEAAHRSGVLHRDLKPANVLVARDGTPYVTDFGLARRLTGHATVTGTGMMVGTPAFMAPEQFSGGKGGRITVAADIYGLGALLYALLSGAPPFSGSVLEIMQQAAASPPVPLRQRCPAAPRDLEAVVMTCLAMDPRRRYVSAGALRDDLRRFLDGRQVSARPAGLAEKVVRFCRRRPWQTVALLAAAGGITAAVLSMAASARARTAETRRQETEMVATNLRRANYAADMMAASIAVEQRRYMAARTLSHAHIPAGGPDERGIEWHLLQTELVNYSDRTLPGLPGVPLALAITADAGHACVAGRGFVVTGDLATGQWTPLLSSSSASADAPVFLGAAISDDRQFAAAATLEEVHVWEIASRRELRVLPRASDGNNLHRRKRADTRTDAAPSSAPVMFRPGTTLLFASGTGPDVTHNRTRPPGNIDSTDDPTRHSATLWSVPDFAPQWTIAGSVHFATFTPDGASLYTIDDDDFQRLNVEDGGRVSHTSIAELEAKEGANTVIARFSGLHSSPDGRWISIAARWEDDIGTLLSYDSSGKRGWNMMRLESDAVCSCIPAAGVLFYGSGSDGLTMAYSVSRAKGTTSTLQRGTPGHDGPVTVLAAAPGCDAFVSGGTDRRLRIWGRRAREDPRRASKGISAGLKHPIQISDGGHCVSILVPGSMSFFMPESEEARELEIDGIASLGFDKNSLFHFFVRSPEGARFGSVDPDTLAPVQGALLQGPLKAEAPCRTTFSASAGLGALWNAGGLALWRISDGSLIMNSPEPATNESVLVLSPDGTRLVGSTGPSLRIWSPGTAEMRTIELPDMATNLNFAPDSRRIAVTFRSVARVLVLDILTGEEQWLEGLRRPASNALFSPDGRTLIAIADAAHFWHLSSGRLVYVYEASNQLAILQLKVSSASDSITMILANGRVDTIRFNK